MANKAFIPIIVGMMLVTGGANTLLTKLQDMQCVSDCDVEGKARTFKQPIIQTAQMFVGEAGCWIVVLALYIRTLTCTRNVPSAVIYERLMQVDDDDLTRAKNDEALTFTDKGGELEVDERVNLTGWKIALLALPACCDITATTMMNIGMLFVAASVHQMVRGSLVLFVGAFSVLFLRKKLSMHHWLSLVIVFLGVGLVGLASSMDAESKNDHGHVEPTPDLARDTLSSDKTTATQTSSSSFLQNFSGVLIILSAQVFVATQFCLEEFILERHAIQPLEMVAWEGTFGLIITLLGQFLLHITVGISASGKDSYLDARAGYHEIFTNRNIAIIGLTIMVCLGSFNFFSLSVTRSISATSRSIIDTCRAPLIWMVSLGVGWETFSWLQVVGFALLAYGTLAFNGLIRLPTGRAVAETKREPDLSLESRSPAMSERDTDSFLVSEIVSSR